MLHPGLYEQVINNALTGELAEIPEARKSVAPIDKAEASKVLAQYLADVVQKGLDNVLDNGGDISAQIGLTNQIVDLIQSTTKEADFAALGVDRRAEQLLALLRETDPRLAVGKTAADIERPETSIAQSSLFTGAVHEPQMFTELKKEIVSADRIDMLVSFIKWSGLRLIMDELREFTHSGGEIRIITTSYMGATDVKAIEELRKLPNTHIKVSYNTKATRLHAKAYIFYRETGFTTAYVGSSIVRGLVVGLGVYIVTLFFTPPVAAAPAWIVVFAFLGAALLGTLGLIAGLWADKFDQMAAFQNFLIMPMTFLSGVFYSIQSLPSFWQQVSHLNPFFYMIDGFRYGFFGQSDVSPWVSLAIVGVAWLLVSGVAIHLLRIGYKIRH